MRFLLCAVFLHVSLTCTTCQAAPDKMSAGDITADGSKVTNHRADIVMDDGMRVQFPPRGDVNQTKFREEVSPDRKSSSTDTNCSCVKEMMALQADLKAEANERLSLKATVDNFVSEVHNLQKMVYTNSSKLIAAPAIAAKEMPLVAFSAKLSYNRELKPLDTVVFDTVLTNNGSPYNAETGMFTAPLSGAYMFQTTILSGYNTKVETAIIVNDKEVARIYSGAHDAHGSGSNMAIVDLRKGDKVWVRLLYQGGSHVHGYYSTFSGALLHRVE